MEDEYREHKKLYYVFVWPGPETQGRISLRRDTKLLASLFKSQNMSWICLLPSISTVATATSISHPDGFFSFLTTSNFYPCQPPSPHPVPSHSSQSEFKS